MNLRAKICAGTKHSLLLLIVCFVALADALAVKGQVIYSFSGGSDGEFPTALISDANGNFYGATEFSANFQGGTIFELVKDGSGYDFVLLYTFTEDTSGIDASGSLTLDNQGNLYGTTSTGGDNYKGSVFELSPAQGGSWTLTVLYSFADGADGGYPYGGVILDKTGNLYGTASEGGLTSDCSGAGCGVVFELSPGAGGNWMETVLHSFAETEGALPSTGLIFGPNGPLYGTTVAGGTSSACEGFPANGCGTVFQLVPSAQGWTETTLYSFSGEDGDYPEGLAAYRGSLFGTTFSGGTQGEGTVFELSRTDSGLVESTLHSFGAGTDATQPLGAVVFDKKGNLYGSASRGANPACNQGCGAIFALTPNDGSWKETILHRFTGGPDGDTPYSTPVISGTALFGIASGGGSGYGTVFQLIR